LTDDLLFCILLNSKSNEKEAVLNGSGVCDVSFSLFGGGVSADRII